MSKSTYLFLSVLAAALLGPVTASTLYTTGHGDITATYAGGELHLSYRLDYTSTVDVSGAPDDWVDDISVSAFIGGTPIPGTPARKRFEAGEIMTYIPGPSIARPEAASWDFIGNNTGDPTWYMPQVQDFAKPWLGFSSEELAASEWSSYTLSLASITSSAGGEFALTTTGTFGGNTLLWTSYPTIDNTDVFNIGLNTHAHANWWFSEPGIYEITLRANGVHVTDGPKEAFATFTFGVEAMPVPEPSVVLMLLSSGAALFRRRQRQTSA